MRSLLLKWFRSRRSTQMAKLEELLRKQQQKVEELKKKTSYYTTKGLIERFESPNKEFKEDVILRKRVSTPELGSSI